MKTSHGSLFSKRTNQVTLAFSEREMHSANAKRLLEVRKVQLMLMIQSTTRVRARVLRKGRLIN